MGVVRGSEKGQKSVTYYLNAPNVDNDEDDDDADTFKPSNESTGKKLLENKKWNFEISSERWRKRFCYRKIRLTFFFRLNRRLKKYFVRLNTFSSTFSF